MVVTVVRVEPPAVIVPARLLSPGLSTHTRPTRYKKKCRVDYRQYGRRYIPRLEVTSSTTTVECTTKTIDKAWSSAARITTTAPTPDEQNSHIHSLKPEPVVGQANRHTFQMELLTLLPMKRRYGLIERDLEVSRVPRVEERRWA